ncbi:hypothetical protein ALCH109712_07830 [Alkalicoccus chagannorensis]
MNIIRILNSKWRGFYAAIMTSVFALILAAILDVPNIGPMVLGFITGIIIAYVINLLYIKYHEKKEKVESN